MQELISDTFLTATAQRVVDHLRQRRLTLVTAESCTAGMIAALLSTAEGATAVLQGGFVAYTKEHKVVALGVSAPVLRDFGAVSEQTACQLAQGALERSTASLVLAITGVLGPAPDEDGAPVGRIYLCCQMRDGKPHIVHEEFGKGERDEIGRKAIVSALSLVEDSL